MKKPIYQDLCDHIVNSKLSSNYSLDSYLFKKKDDLSFAMGAIDGICFFHTGSQKDQDFIEECSSYFTFSFEECYLKLISYFQKHPQFSLISSVDSFLDKISLMKISKNDLFPLVSKLLFESTSIEAIKLGISLCSFFDLNLIPDFSHKVLQFGLCDEFALYIDFFVLNDLFDGNEIRFSFAQKVSGWGKIFYVRSLKNNSSEINQFLMTTAIENNVDSSYVAYFIYEKIDYLSLLKTNLSSEEFLGMSHILSSLIQENILPGISNIDDSFSLFQSYISLKRFSSISYYMVLGDIAHYLEEHPNPKLLKKILSISKKEEVISFLLSVISTHIHSDIIRILPFLQISLSYYEQELFSLLEKEPVLSFYLIPILYSKYSNQINFLYNKDISLKKYYNKPQNIYFGKDSFFGNVVLLLGVLENYPGVGIPYVICSLHSKYMYPRIGALHVLQSWQKKHYEFPSSIQEALMELKSCEVVEHYIEIIDEILEKMK